MITMTAAVAILALSTIATAGVSRHHFVTEVPAGPLRGILVCRITSDAGEAPRVRVQALDAAGRATSDSGSFRLERGATFLSSGGIDARRCRFTVEGDPTDVRADGLIVSEGRANASLVPLREREH